MSKGGRFEVAVTFEERRGYVGSAPELCQPVVALSLGGLRRKVEIAMLRDDVIVTLNLDRASETGARSQAAERTAAPGLNPCCNHGCRQDFQSFGCSWVPPGFSSSRITSIDPASPCHGAMMSCQPYSGASNLSARYTARGWPQNRIK